MKKWTGFKIHKLYEMFYAFFLCAGLIIMLADGYFLLSWPRAALLVSVLLSELLLYWSEEKGVRIQVWGLAAVLTALGGGLHLYRTGADLDFYWFFLGMEASYIAGAVLCYVARQSF